MKDTEKLVKAFKDVMSYFPEIDDYLLKGNQFRIILEEARRVIKKADNETN